MDSSPPHLLPTLILIPPAWRHTQRDWIHRKCFRIFIILLDQKPGEETLEWLRVDFSVKGLGFESWFHSSVAVGSRAVVSETLSSSVMLGSLFLHTRDKLVFTIRLFELESCHALNSWGHLVYLLFIFL